MPLSVLAGTPIAVFGAVAGLFISRMFSESYENNVFAQIGLVMLIGLAAKNAILIVEFAKLESEKGRDAIEAAMEAAKLRFRPILMTAFSFILGVLPLLIATGAGAEARAEIAKRLNDIIVENGGMIPLVHRGRLSAHSNTLGGVVLNVWDSELWNAADWYRIK